MYNFTLYNILINKTHFIMKKLLLLIIAIIAMNVANAQWQQTSFTNSLASGLAADGNNVIVGTWGSGMYLSLDNGNTWTTVNSGILGNALLIDVLYMNGNKIYSGNMKGLYFSSNYGNSWTLLNFPQTETFGLAIKGDTILVENAVYFYYSFDNGISSSYWDPIMNGPGYGYLPAINGNNYWAGTNNGLYLSKDKGNSWILSDSGLTCINIGAFAFKDNMIFLGTLNGIFKSIDNGSSWTAISNGLPINTWIDALIINDSNIFAGTNNGIYLSNNDGASWSAINLGLPTDNLVKNLVINNNFLFAMIDTFGVWKRPLSDFVGIKENTLNNNISIYPNPTKDILTIETNLNTQQKLEISNLMGQTIYTYYIYNKATINTSAWASGVYILKLNTDKQTVVRKIVKE